MSRHEFPLPPRLCEGLVDEASRSLLLAHLEAVATNDDDRLQKRLLKELVRGYVALERRVNALLCNTLPREVADSINYEGRFAPRSYACTVLFTDFVGFTQVCERVSGDAMVETLATVFSAFDDLVAGRGGTKIKTIGDAYMAVFGAPSPLAQHAACAIHAALDLFAFLDDFNRSAPHPFEMRAGIHTGRVTAGVVGRQRMQFDVFGDDVNIAARYESAGKPGRVNVSEATRQAAGDRFAFEPRGPIDLKHKACMNAYFVVGPTEGKAR